LKKKAGCLAVTMLFLPTMFVLFGPGFLCTGDVPRKADAVVLFLGPGYDARFNEAKQLIKERYARYLLIPYYGQLFSADNAGGLVKLDSILPSHDLFQRNSSRPASTKNYDSTHIEALEAKRMMDERGLQSAILVSSSYHMRRIRLIAGRVFDARNYLIFCNPGRRQAPFTAADWFNKEHRKIIVKEYVKIGWFLVYSVVGS
jgi:hypothetical protein